MLLRFLPAALTVATAVAGLSLAMPARAIGSLIDVQVMDRGSGETLPVYWHNGRWWVPGKPGARYAVALNNRSGERALTVISIDGVNVVSGETAATDQGGYVLSPNQFTQITGWRKNLSRVAAFEFTSLADSYAARTGRPDNVGVIGVAVFREKPKSAAVPPVTRSDAPARDASGASSGAPAPSAKSSADEASSASADSRQREQVAGARSEPRTESRIGTGHGSIERSPSSYTEFERAQATPNETITIYYDSHANLVAMGVIPTPRHAPNPFPATAGFVPDPPRR